MDANPESKHSHRLTELTATNFRGWLRRHEIDLDADIVLVTSANGHGKSSLIEALGRILNGKRRHNDDDNRSIFGEENADGASEQHWSLKIRRIRGGSEVETSIEYDSSKASYETKEEARSDLEHGEPLPSAKLLRRSTTFVQDLIDAQFESEEDRSSSDVGSLIDFLTSEPPWVIALKNALAQVPWKGLQADANEVGLIDPVQFLHDLNRHSEQAINELIEELRFVELEADPFTLSIKPESAYYDLRTIAERLLPESAASNDGSAILQVARLMQERFDRSSESRSIDSKSNEDMWRHRDRLAADEQAWPNLGFVQERFEKDSYPLREILTLLDGLAAKNDLIEERELWSQWIESLPQSSQRLVPSVDEIGIQLPRELERVDRGSIQRYRKALKQWSAFWQERIAIRKKLLAEWERTRDSRKQRSVSRPLALAQRLKRIANLERTYNDARNRLVKQQNALEAWKKLEPYHDALEKEAQYWAKRRDESLLPDTKHKIVQGMESVLRHFVIAGLDTGADSNFVKASIPRDESHQPVLLELADGRKVDLHLSTGQRTQMALAWMLACNQLLQRWLPHRVLLLDDISMALDLGNMAGACALLRKIAYTKKSRRRQIIMACHNDQLTNRMLDYLIPPEGYTMLEIRIVNWSPQQGPVLERAKINPTRKADADSRQLLARRLEAAVVAPGS